MRVLAGSIVLLLALVTSVTAWAESSDKEAKAAFARGKELFGKGDYEGAAAAFREANELKPNWKLLYNIGQSEAAAKRHGLALTAFESYLSQGGDDVPEARLDSVLAEVKRLREMVGLLEIDAPEGATVSVDGVARGDAPLAGKIPVAASVVHVVTASMDGRALPERKVKVLGGMTAKVELAAGLAPTEGPAPAEEEDARGEAEEENDDAVDVPSDGEGGSVLKPLGWIAVGVGGAALIAGGVTGGMAMSVDSDVKSKCPGGECPPSYEDEVDRRDRLALTTDILIPVGAVVAATGAVLLILDAVKGKESAGVAAVPYVVPEGGGASVRWRF